VASAKMLGSLAGAEVKGWRQNFGLFSSNRHSDCGPSCCPSSAFPTTTPFTLAGAGQS